MEITFVQRNDPRRGIAEAFVQRVYDDAYGACPDKFPAHMAAAFSPSGRPLAAAGIRVAEDGFFSECYLDAPLEQIARAKLGHDISRDEILEITTLASIQPAAMLALMLAIYQHGRECGLKLGLFTATAHLRRRFARLGMHLTPVAHAIPSRVANSDTWGRYYEADPMTCLCADPGVQWAQRLAQSPEVAPIEPLPACA